MTGDSIKCGGKTVGWIERTSCDNYWTIASFKPGDDYDLFKELLEATLAEDDGDLIAQERVNELNLVIGDSLAPIRDFQMTSMTTVEFKEGAWA